MSLLPAVTSPMAIFSDGSTVLGQAPVAANGTATLPVAGLVPGLHTATVSIEAANIAYAVSPPVNVTVNAAVVLSTPAAPVAPSTSSVPSPSASATATAAAEVPGLAQTGVNGALLLVGSAVVLLAAGGILLVVRRRGCG
ncbi:LPXTG cell wall anchor domain-containing protein [Arthrobacter glacialis]